MKKPDRDQRIKMDSEAAQEAENLRIQREAEAEAQRVHEVSLQEQEENKRLAPYLGGLPYDRNRVVQEVKFYINRSCQDMIEAGKRLVALKEKEGWQDWIRIVENEVGVGWRTACRFMAIAKKFDSCHAVTALTVSYEKGIGKLYALLDVPDEELQEFEKTGELRGMTVDEIDRMSVKDLRDKLRRRDKQIDQGKLQLQEVEAKVKELEDQLAKKEPLFSSEEERDMAFLQEAQRTFWQALALAKRVNPEAGLKARYELYSLLHLFAKITEEEAFQIMQAFPDVTAGVMMDLDTGKWETEDRNPFPEVRKALKKLRGEGDGDNGAQGTRS